MTVTEQEQAPAASGRTRGARALAVAAATVVLVVVATVAVAWLRHGTDRAPYDDPSTTGRLTLCDADGHAVTSGTVDRPLAAAVHGATAAAVGDGVIATLYAFQPREGTGPSEWNGLPLTAPALVADPARPVLAPADDSVLLSQFLGGYPAAWDGWVQLRLVVGSAESGAVTSSYDALDLHVDGDRWTAVDPGTASCSS